MKLEPKAPWECKRMEDLEESDFSIYDDYSEPYMFACKRFVYKNKATIEQEKAIAEYEERSRNLSPYDAIAPPPNSRLCGGVRPFLITDDLRPRLINLCTLALEKYNADNQGANFVFDDLVKTTGKLVCGVIFYITFKAKDASNGAAQTFQAQVWDTMLPKNAKPPVVDSCSIKPT